MYTQNRGRSNLMYTTGRSKTSSDVVVACLRLWCFERACSRFQRQLEQLRLDLGLASFQIIQTTNSSSSGMRVMPSGHCGSGRNAFLASASCLQLPFPLI